MGACQQLAPWMLRHSRTAQRFRDDLLDWRELFELLGFAPGSSSVASPTNNLNCVGLARSGTRPGTISLRALAWAASTPW